MVGVRSPSHDPLLTIPPVTNAAGIVLAGGRSSRMGSPKAALEWHGSTLLARVSGILARSVDGPVIVVRASGQELPELAAAVEVVDDAREGRGPLQGLLAGLEAIGDRASIAYVSCTDASLLHPAFVRRVVDAHDADADIVLPEVDGHRQPLAASYRVGLLATVAELIAADRLRPASLFERSRVLRIGADALLEDPVLARLDPELSSLTNLNAPADYQRARALAAPEVHVQRCGALAARTGPRRAIVRAYTLGTAASAVGLKLDEHVVAALNGDPICCDPQLPLVAGDSVAFMAADGPSTPGA